MEDAFGNGVKVGDQVIYSHKGMWNGELRRGKITKTMEKMIIVDNKYRIHKNCFIRDIPYEMELRNRFLRCLELCGIGDWIYYQNAVNLYEASFKV